MCANDRLAESGVESPPRRFAVASQIAAPAHLASRPTASFSAAVRSGSNIGSFGRAWENTVHRFAATVTACALIAGCAGTIKEGMARLEGQPLSTAIAKLGLPIEEQTIAGMKVYVWGSPGMLPKGAKACQLRAIMNGEVIGSFEYEGNESVCQRYAERLRLQPGILSTPLSGN
jgi:hypothetical protein